MDRKIITLCGSTRHRSAFEEANARLSLEGHIVLSVGMFGRDPTDSGKGKQGNTELTMEQKKELDALHWAKIGLSQEILVLNVDGYIGESTQREIWYTRSQKKRVRFLNPVAGDSFDRRVVEILKNPLICLNYPGGMNAIDINEYTAIEFPLCTAIDVANALQNHFH